VRPGESDAQMFELSDILMGLSDFAYRPSWVEQGARCLAWMLPLEVSEHLSLAAWMHCSSPKPELFARRVCPSQLALGGTVELKVSYALNIEGCKRFRSEGGSKAWRRFIH
jgi:hypothetical protein